MSGKEESRIRMKSNKMKEEQDELNTLNKQISEMKKKILLFEGERKAHYDMWHSEKKKNAERISELKIRMKQLISNSISVSSSAAQETGGMKMNSHQNEEEMMEKMELKIGNARKKLDLLKHQIVQMEEQICNLEEIKLKEERIISKRKWHSNAEKPRRLTNSSKTENSRKLCLSLEDELYRVQMTAHESEHLRKKYNVIKKELTDHSVYFEQTLRSIEQQISSQQKEIKTLLEGKEEADRLRDETTYRLLEQQKKIHQAESIRQIQYQQLKKKVDNYKMELEHLERQLANRNKQSDDRGLADEEAKLIGEDVVTISPQEEFDVEMPAEKLHSIFEIFRKATGVTENERVLGRFLSQKQTKLVLEKMKNQSEAQKEQLGNKRELLLADLESCKFADMNDQQQNEEEKGRKMWQEMEMQKEKQTKMNMEMELVRQQISSIMKGIHRFCLLLKDVDVAKVPDKCPNSVEQCDWLCALLFTKIESALHSHLSHGTQTPSIALHPLLLTGKSHESSSKSRNTDQSWMSAGMGTLVAGYGADEEAAGEEEEIASRQMLKRDAQIIFESRSRRKPSPANTSTHSFSSFQAYKRH